MPQSANIPTTTQVTSGSGGALSIFTFYDAGYFHVINAFIAAVVGTLLGTSYKEGELVITMRNSPSEVNCFINSNGELIIFALPGETYSLDSNGNLIAEVNI